MRRELTSWVAAVLLLVATGTLPWTWGEGTAFSRTFEVNGGVTVVWWESSSLDWAGVVILVVAVGFVVRIPRWTVAVLAGAGAVACLAAPDRGTIGGVLLALCALVLGVVAVSVPTPTTRPRLVPVLAGVVLLAVALAPTAITIEALSDQVLVELLRFALAEPWVATVLIAAAAAVALTPSLPGGRRRALVPVVCAAVIALANVVAEDAAFDVWRGWPIAGAALVAAAVALVRAPEAA